MVLMPHGRMVLIKQPKQLKYFSVRLLCRANLSDFIFYNIDSLISYTNIYT